MWAGLLGMGLAAGAFWVLAPERRVEAQALLSLCFLLYLNAAILELVWRRTRRRHAVTREEVREIAEAARRADPASIASLIDHLCRGSNAAEVRLALIALGNIGTPAVGLLVVRAENSPEPVASLLRALVGQIVGRSFETVEALSAWWAANRLAFQLEALDRRPPEAP